MFFPTYYPQAASLEWKNKENQDTGFKFLFTLFRKYYLPHLFPSFTKLTNVYKPVLGKYSLIPCRCHPQGNYTVDFIIIPLGKIVTLSSY